MQRIAKRKFSADLHTSILKQPPKQGYTLYRNAEVWTAIEHRQAHFGRTALRTALREQCL